MTPPRPRAGARRVEPSHAGGDRAISSLAFRATSWGEHAVLSVEGEVDIHTAASLRRRLLELFEGGHAKVIVDMSAVGFMDSSGLNVLIGAVRAGRRTGGTLRVVADSSHLQQLFVVTGIDRVLPLYPSVAAAAES
jgi:anti-sigma B factor antagonist